VPFHQLGQLRRHSHSIHRAPFPSVSFHMMNVHLPFPSRFTHPVHGRTPPALPTGARLVQELGVLGLAWKLFHGHEGVVALPKVHHVGVKGIRIALECEMPDDRSFCSGGRRWYDQEGGRGTQASLGMGLARLAYGAWGLSFPLFRQAGGRPLQGHPCAP